MGGIVVVGGGLTGLAAAVRLAKRGHRVTLLEQSDRLGGSWAPRSVDGQLLDDAPPVIGFPAPWRDLFRKSGRPLETELARAGRALVPAPPATYVFADGNQLVLPADRAGQYDALSAGYGVQVARWWRDGLDAFDDVWQALRTIGLEAPLTSSKQVRQAGSRLLPGHVVADLADTAPHPHLRAMIRSVAYRQGSQPESTPAWCAVELAVARTFGRWTVDDGRTGVLRDLLVERLPLRRVSVELSTRVERIEPDRGGGLAIRDSQGRQRHAALVVCTADPWQTVDRLLPGHRAWRTRWAVHRLRPAMAPEVRHEPDTAPAPSSEAPVSETVRLSDDGVPVIVYRTPTVRSVHDFTAPRPDPAWGAAWRTPTDWLRRPRIDGPIPGLLMAGAASAAGNSPSQVLLSAALASTAAHDYAQMSVSSGEDPPS